MRDLTDPALLTPGLPAWLVLGLARFPHAAPRVGLATRDVATAVHLPPAPVTA